MERPALLVGARAGIHAVVEAQRADGELVAQAGAHSVAHVAEAGVVGVHEIAGVDEDRALQCLPDGEDELGVEDRGELAAERVAERVLGPQLALGKAAHAAAAAIEEAHVDRELIDDGRDPARARADREQVAFSQREIVGEAEGGAGEGGLPIEHAKVERRAEHKPARRAHGAVAEVERLGQADAREQVAWRAEKQRVDGAFGDLHILHFGEGGDVQVRQDFAPEIDAQTRGGLRVALLLARDRVDARAQREARLEEPRIDVEQLSAERALGAVGGEREGPAASEEIPVAEADACGRALVGAVAEGEADLLRLGLLDLKFQVQRVAGFGERVHAQIREEPRAQHLAEGLVELRGVVDFSPQMLEAPREEVRLQAPVHIPHLRLAEAVERAGRGGEGDGHPPALCQREFGGDGDLGLVVAARLVVGLEVALHRHDLRRRVRSRRLLDERRPHLVLRVDEVAREGRFAEDVARSLDDPHGHVGARAVVRHLDLRGVGGGVEVAVRHVEPAHAVGARGDLAGVEGELLGRLRELLGSGAEHVFVERLAGDRLVAGEGDALEQRARAFLDAQDQFFTSDLVVHLGLGEAALPVKCAEIIRRVIRARRGEPLRCDLGELSGDGRAELVFGECLRAGELDAVLHLVRERADDQVRAGQRAGEIFIRRRGGGHAEGEQGCERDSRGHLPETNEVFELPCEASFGAQVADDVGAVVEFESRTHLLLAAAIVHRAEFDLEALHQ